MQGYVLINNLRHMNTFSSNNYYVNKKLKIFDFIKYYPLRNNITKKHKYIEFIYFALKINSLLYKKQLNNESYYPN